MNKIKCEIFKQDSQDGMSFIQLDCGSERLGVMSLDEGWKVGEIVWANFKESDVMIALDSRISARNKFYSPILSIVHNSILARVVFGFQSYQISSLISYEATKELGLKEGMECFWFVKSNEILLLRG
ncbi:TOBE domain-containing protein [Helicobacter kayseriensis]|uniref:TOBE domain-containing protein n=1 Tax=Helicobacter kayseriensis TaxID=2905877 RepID=UPI001E5E0397|nr:hypothetical protein [Helicobacter kayseriensis]MCE3046580.1 hypothetical protein [Helicobacter kayseriensis]MCE3048118.1 hypothetical protein [Helicobacter kayseriensis]